MRGVHDVNVHMSMFQKSDKVIEILNKLLSQVISQAAGAQSTRDRLKQLALSVAERFVTYHPLKSLVESTISLQIWLLTFMAFYSVKPIIHREMYYLKNLILINLNDVQITS